MKLHPPVKDFTPKLYPLGDVTQFFGENKELYSKYACNPFGCLQGHNGWDIVRALGTPILSVSNGKVVEVLEHDNGFGKHVKVLSDENEEWVYGHLSRIDVSLGQMVVAGEQIGLMGNTGFVISGATPYWKHNPYKGTHLHLGKRRFEPYSGTGSWNLTYSTGDKGTILDYDNGFFGAVPFSGDDFTLGTVAVVPSPTLEMTLQSLENNAVQAEKEGKPAQAAIIRAIKGVVSAFWQ